MSTAAAPAATRAAQQHSAPMSHRQVLETLSGLLLGMFVAILSSTVVSNALPTIVSELNGTESGYTWVVTSTLLATTISTPIWGKLADLVSKKVLVQAALVIFVVASMVAGLSQNMGMLITTRVFQGLGAGGLTALSQVILATIVSPRERGRYSGYLGATFALGTVAGPLIGGALTEHLSWRWCFYVGVPFAVLAFIVLQVTLNLPTIKRKAHIDYLGAILLAGGVSSLLVWVSLAGQQFDWWSWETAAMVGGGLLLLGLTVLAERIAPEPMIPLRLFRRSTTVLASLASLFVGIGMFAGTVFLSQYFQIARGDSPLTAGVRTIPLIVGLFLSSTISGQVITRTGQWKSWLVTGGVVLTAGLGLLATIDYDSNYWLVAVYMCLVGLGIGMMMQNLVVAVQNEVAVQDLGAASSFVAFARSMGGAIGVSALGAVLGNRVSDHLADNLAAAGINARAMGHSTSIPNVSSLPEPIRSVVENSYGQAIAEVFLVAAPFAFIAFLVTLFIKETALRTSIDGAPAGEDSRADEAPTEEFTEQTWNTPDDHVDVHAPAPMRLGLTGFVTQGADRPLADAQVTLADRSGRQVARTVSGADGGYRLDLDNGGTYLLIVAAPNVSPTADLVAVSDAPVRHDVTLSGRSAITGRVLRSDRRLGQDLPVDDALVTLTDVTGQVVGHARTTADGTYAFDALTAGLYVLTAQSGGHRPVARSVDVTEAGAVACDLALSGGGRLTGAVLAAVDDRPVRHASVTLVDAQGQVAGTSTTGDDGAYAFEDVEPGRYTLTAAGYAPVAQDVVVEEDGVTTAPARLGSQGDRASVEAGSL